MRETAAYIATRLRIAGGECARIFTRDAVMTIHERSRGIPRSISVICDNALLSGFAADQRPVGRDIVLEVCNDFDIHPAEQAPVMQAPAPAIIPAAAPIQPAVEMREPVAVGQNMAAPRRRSFVRVCSSRSRAAGGSVF